jgi:hypothetical protein
MPRLEDFPISHMPFPADPAESRAGPALAAGGKASITWKASTVSTAPAISLADENEQGDVVPDMNSSLTVNEGSTPMEVHECHCYTG